MRGIDIRIDRLSCRLGGKEILSSMTFEVPAGKHLSIIGPNGAGKTTLLKCIMRILPISNGSIEIRGRKIGEYSQKKLARDIGYVPQNAGRSIPFTVEELVLMGRYPYLSPFSSVTPEDRDAARSALDMTGTLALSDRGFDSLSGGEQQLVLIASVLAQGSGIILLDEPATFLDPKHAEEVYRILRRIREEMNATILSVTHDINSSLMVSDAILAIKDGKRAYYGKTGDLTAAGVLDEVFDKKFLYSDHPVSGTRIIMPDVIR
ncbi:MAG: ABC transporter ATP-binding protein [Candidatus Krumholzibacteriota bacterium]|nr:ABC transporter ATP-binding protein [Candidatus Krumholzibacteriota bacterium]